MNKKTWHVLYLKERCINKVMHTLHSKRIEFYLPAIRQSTRRKILRKPGIEPLFHSYLFINADETILNVAKKIHGVISLVFWLNKPVQVQSREIELLRLLLSHYPVIKIEKTIVEPYKNVELVRLQPEVLHSNKKTIQLQLSSLGYLITAEDKIGNVRLFTKESFGDGDASNVPSALSNGMFINGK